MRRLIALALLLLTAQGPITVVQPTPTVTAQPLDVMGLRIGQTPEQIRTVLTRYDAGARVTDRVIPGIDGRPFTEGVRLFRSAPAGQASGFTMREDLEIAFSGKASGNRAIGIERRIIYVGDARIPARPVLDSLREKFGPSPEEGRTGGTYSTTGFSVVTWRWLFDTDGTLLRAGAAPNCPSELGQYRANCPVQLTVVLRAKDDKLEGLTMDLKDNPFAVAAMGVDQEAAAQERAQNTIGRPAAPPPRL